MKRVHSVPTSRLHGVRFLFVQIGSLNSGRSLHKLCNIMSLSRLPFSRCRWQQRLQDGKLLHVEWIDDLFPTIAEA